MINSQNKSDIEELVIRFQNGEKEAFSEIYQFFVEKVYKYFFFKTTQEEALDLTETVFLKVWDNIRKYQKKKGASFSAWIFTIARNLLIDHYRNHKEFTELTNLEPDKKQDNQPIFNTERVLSRDYLKKALGKLKESYSEIVVLAFLNDLSNEEIAYLLNKNEGTVRVLKFRALKELKKILLEMGIKYE